jgi:dUTP pyrophosphatase
MTTTFKPHFISKLKVSLIKWLFTNTVYISKINPFATIPTKREEDGCWDLYCIPEKPHEDIIIEPNKIVSVHTGIASAFHPIIRADASRERGSSGSQGIGLRCGQIDSGYRDEWFLKLQTTTDNTIVITDTVDAVAFDKEHKTIYYPLKKAVCQIAMEFVVPIKLEEIDYHDLESIPSERGLGKLGSSGK